MKNQTLVVLTLFVVAAPATPGRSQQIMFADQPTRDLEWVAALNTSRHLLYSMF